MRISPIQRLLGFSMEDPTPLDTPGIGGWGSQNQVVLKALNQSIWSLWVLKYAVCFLRILPCRPARPVPCTSSVRISGLLPWRKLPAKPPAKPKPKAARAQRRTASFSIGRSPSDWCPFTVSFLGKGSPAKIDYRKKKWREKPFFHQGHWLQLAF